MHKGHDFLIRTAQKHCDRLTIMIVQQPGQKPSGKLRERWLKKSYPQASVILVDDIYKDGDSKAWADFTIKVLGYAPDIVFTSERYGQPWSDFMGSKHILVDLERKNVPISAREIRKDPLAKREFIDSDVREYYAKRTSAV